MPRTLDELLGLLDLETIDDNLFRGAAVESVLPQVYGGQVAAQSLVAATRTVDPAYAIHSLHSYFLQPGDTSAAIIYDVEALRDSRSFSTRRVLARQHGRPIFALTADFQREESAWDHQRPMPEVPGPEDCLDPRELLRAATTDGFGEFTEWDVIDFRYVGSSADKLEGGSDPGRQQVWMKVSGRLPDDPRAHAAALTYASDMTLPGAAMAPHGYVFGDPRVRLASLDHAVWFHRPLRADEWWLYDQVSANSSGARALIDARVYARDGALVASVSQELLMRERRR